MDSRSTVNCTKVWQTNAWNHYIDAHNNDQPELHRSMMLTCHSPLHHQKPTNVNPEAGTQQYGDSSTGSSWVVCCISYSSPSSLPPPIKCQCYTTRQASASTSTFSEWTWPCQFPSVFFFQLSQNRTFVTSWHRLLTNQLSFWSLNRRSQGLKGTWSTNTDQWPGLIPSLSSTALPMERTLLRDSQWK